MGKRLSKVKGSDRYGSTRRPWWAGNCIRELWQPRLCGYLNWVEMTKGKKGDIRQETVLFSCKTRTSNWFSLFLPRNHWANNESKAVPGLLNGQIPVPVGILITGWCPQWRTNIRSTSLHCMKKPADTSPHHHVPPSVGGHFTSVRTLLGDFKLDSLH